MKSWRILFFSLLLSTLCESCTVPQSLDSIIESAKDLVFVMEQSDDWTSSQFDTIKNFVKDVLFGLCLGSDAIRVGLMTYSTDTNIHLYLNNVLNSTEIMSVVDGVPFSGNNLNMTKALEHVETHLLKESNGDRPEVQNLLIIISDGKYNNGGNSASQKSQDLKDQGVELYVVCLGHDPDVDQLSQVASDPDSKYLMCNDSLHFPGYLQLFKKMFLEDRKSVTEAASLNGYKYRFLNTKESFADADSYCRELRGSLTSLDDDEEKQYVTERVKALSYLAECSQWWIGLYGPIASFNYWTDGTIVNVSDFAVPSGISNSSTAVVLDQNFNFQWQNEPMAAEWCFICKMPSNYTNLVILTESYSVTTGNPVKLAVLLNDTTSDDVKIQVNGQEYCSLIVNLSVSAAERSSLPLSLFGLTDAVDTHFYGVFDIWFQTNGSYILTASTFLYSSIPVVLKSGFESEVVANCLNALTINGTGQTLTDSPSFNINEAHIFTATIEGTCPALQMVSYTWTVYLSRYQNPNLCTSEDVYQVINIPSSSDSISNDSDLHIAPQLLSAGYYKICVTLLTSYMLTPYSRMYCGFFHICSSPLVLILSPNGTSLVHNTNLPLVLDATGSYDLSGNTSFPLNYTWLCEQSQTMCDVVGQLWPNITLNTTQLPISGGLLQIPGNLLTVGENYTFHLSINKEGVSGQNVSVGVFTEGELFLNISCISGCDAEYDPRISLSIHPLSSNCGSSEMSYMWQIEVDGVGPLPNSTWLSSAILQNNGSLSVPTSTFLPLYSYTIKVQATNPGGTGEAVYNVSANNNTGVTIVANKNLVSSNDLVTYAVLVNDSTPESVQISLNGHEYCELIVNKIVDVTERNSLPLSIFGFYDIVDGMLYGVFQRKFGKASTYTMTALTSLGTSVPNIVIFDDDADIESCLHQWKINGTGDAPKTSVDCYINHTHTFGSNELDSCSGLTVQSHSWLVYSSKYENPSSCTVEADYEVTGVSSSDEYFHLAANTLAKGVYRMCLSLEFSHNSANHNRSICGYFHIVDTLPLVIVMSPSGTSLVHNTSQPLVLNATESYDPNGGISLPINYTWLCEQRQTVCEFVGQMWLNTSLNSTQLPVSGGLLEIPGILLSVGENYTFHLSISKEGVAGQNVSIRVLTKGELQLDIRCLGGCNVTYDTGSYLSLHTQCSNCGPNELTYMWQIEVDDTGLLPNSTWLSSATLHPNGSLTLPSSTFLPLHAYDITVQGRNNFGDTGQAMFFVPVNEPPTAGSCNIVPTSGQIVLTQFMVSCHNFIDIHLPLKTRISVSKDGSDHILYEGNKTTVSHVILLLGPTNVNFTQVITLTVLDAFNVGTSLNVTVEIFAHEEEAHTVSDQILEVVTNLSVSSESSDDGVNVLDFISSASNILNIEAVIHNDTDLEQRTEARELLFDLLIEVPVEDVENLQQMTEAVKNVIFHKEEMSKSAQDKALNVSTRIADTLLQAASSDPDVVQSVCISEVQNLDTLIDYNLNDYESSGEGGGLANASAVNEVRESISTILNVYERLGDAMLKGVLTAVGEPLKIEGNTTSLALTRANKDGNATKLTAKLQGSSVEGSFSINLKEGLKHSESASCCAGEVNFQVQVLKTNPYVWDASADEINLPVVSVMVKDRQTGEPVRLENLNEPAEIIVTSNTSDMIESMRRVKQVNVTSVDIRTVVVDNTIVSSESKRVMISGERGTILKIKPVNNSLNLQTLTIFNDNITAKGVFDFGQQLPVPPEKLQVSGILVQDPELIILPAGGNDSYYNVGFQVKAGQFFDTGGKDFHVVTVTIESFTVSCTFWNEDLEVWSHQGCQVGQLTHIDRLHCVCDHLTAFSGGIFVAPNTVNPLVDTALFLTFFDNPVVVTAVLALWNLFILLFIWARKKDIDDSKKIGMTVLTDNNPEDKYVYLICVVTSWWPGAGTSANVFLYLCSKIYQSARHWLDDSERKLFTPGAENWFVLTTPRRLGNITSVVVWHDNHGKFASWHLKEVVVYDVQTKETWHCLYNNWLSVSKGPSILQAQIPSLPKDEFKNQKMYQFSLKSSKDFRNSHMWFSIFSKPAHDTYTRCQRLMCALTVIITYMLSSIMFHGIPTDDPDDQLEHGGMFLSLSAVVIGIESSLLMFPVSFLIVQLFMRTSPRSKWFEEPDQMKLPRTRDANGAPDFGPLERENSKVHTLFSDICQESNEDDNDDKYKVFSDDKDKVVSDDSEYLLQYDEDDENNDVHSNDIEREYVYDNGVLFNFDFLKDDKNEEIEEDKKSEFSDNKDKGTIHDRDHFDFLNNRNQEKKDDGENVLPSDKEKENLCHKDSTVFADKSLNGVKKIKRKAPFRFPWWMLHIAWTISIFTCVTCSYFIMLYGLKYGYQKSLDWLVSFMISILQSALVTQPFKVLAVAVIMTIILKRPVAYDSWSSSEETEEKEIDDFVSTIQTASQRPAQERNYVSPLPIRVLNMIRHALKLDIKAKMIMQEIVVYLSFVIIFTIVVDNYLDITTAHLVTESTEMMFTSEDSGFEEVNTVDSVWEYLEEVLVNNLVTNFFDSGATSCVTSYLLGKTRLRQVRVKPSECLLMKESIFSASVCSRKNGLANEDNMAYNNTWQNPLPSDTVLNGTSRYTHHEANELLSMFYIGKVSSYSGGGYVQELPRSPDEAVLLLHSIKETDWINHDTRALFVEFNLYNPSIDMLSLVVLIFEYTNHGGVLPTHRIYTTKLYRYTKDMPIFNVVCEVLFVLFILVLSYKEIKRFRSMPWLKYFRDVWSYIEISSLGFSFAIIGLLAQRGNLTEKSLKQYRQTGKNSYVSFYPGVFSDLLLFYISAFLSLIIILKFFKLLRFSHRLSLFYHTLKYSSHELVPFLIEFGIILVAASMTGIKLFGSNMYDFCSIHRCLMTLVSFQMGEVEYLEMEKINRSMAPVYFLLFLISCHIVMLNFSISILINGLRTTLKHANQVETEVYMIKFFKRRLRLMLIRDTWKRKVYRKRLYDLRTRISRVKH